MRRLTSYNSEEDYNGSIGHNLADIILRQQKNVAVSKEDKLKQIVLKYNPKKIYNSQNKWRSMLKGALGSIKKAGFPIYYNNKDTSQLYNIYINFLKQNNIPFS